MKDKLTTLIEQMTAKEQRDLLKSLDGKLTSLKAVDHCFSATHDRFGYYSDPHVGQKEFSEPLWMKMTAFFKKEGITRVYCPGDNLEGMSGRPGHIYELAQVGAAAQLDYATKLFQFADTLTFFVIDGNHDQWFKEKGNIGLIAGQELQNRCKNVIFLGEWEANVRLHKNVVMKLYHANDGTA